MCDAPIGATGSAICGFDAGDILAGIAFRDNPGPDTDALVLFGGGTSLNATQVLVANTFTDAFEIAFDPPVLAAGMDLHSSPGAGLGPPDTLIVEIFENDVLLDWDPDADASGAGNFWGVSSPAPMARLRLMSVSNAAEGIDNLAFPGDA